MPNELLSPDVGRFLEKSSEVKKIELPRREDMPPDLIGIAETVADISGTWNPVEIFTPSRANINAERDKVFEAYLAGSEYNPTFDYPAADDMADLTEARDSLTSLLARTRDYKTGDRPTRLFRLALTFKIFDDLATCDLVDGLKTKNEDLIESAMHRKYPGLDASIIDLAQREYERQTNEGEPKPVEGQGQLSKEEIEWLKDRKISADEQEHAFTWALDQYGIYRRNPTDRGFKVLVTDAVTAIDVRDKSVNGPTVYAPMARPEGAQMRADRLLWVLAHEIEGHAVQSVNGEELFLLGGGRLKIDNEQYYEGLGLRREMAIKKKLFGVDEPAPRPFYPFSVDMAERGATFFDIYKNQVERHARVELAKPSDQPLPPLSELDEKTRKKILNGGWVTTYRVMRGHTDTTNQRSFAMAKDLGYLRGYQTDRQLSNSGYGFLNEAGIIAKGGLQLLAELNISEDDLPIKFQDVTTKYWEDILKPQMKAEATP